MNKKNNPLVSIGMTVYNGEKFLEKSIVSLLDQDYPNFELIICDNCSEDSSHEICLKYKAIDSRIKYLRNNKNIGASANFNQAYLLSSGEYFMWAADHDQWDKAFISDCIEPMINDPSVALSYGLTVLIDGDDNVIEVMSDRLDTRNLSPSERFIKVMWNIRICNSIYGLMRSSIIKKTGLISKIIGSDHAFLAELNLYGSMVQIEKPVFYRRKNRQKEIEANRIERVINYLNPGGKNLFPMIWANLAYEHFKAVKNSMLSPSEKEILVHQVTEFFKTGRFKNYINTEINEFVNQCIEYFREKKLPVEYPLPKLIAAEALKAISLILPFELKKKEVETVLILCQEALGIERGNSFSAAAKSDHPNTDSVSVVIPTYN
ncbi:MAG: glycosyltransferase, partial [Ignavibacteriaceae bacterium]